MKSIYENSYEMPMLLQEKGCFIPVWNDRGPMADRNPYKWAEVGYKPHRKNQYTYAGPAATELAHEAKVSRRFHIGAEIIGALIISTILVTIVMLICGISIPAHAEGDISFPSYWQYDTELVKQIQSRLNYFTGSNLTIDGKFGPATSAVVKNFQKREGLTISGVVDDETAGRLQATSWPKGTTLYYMSNLERIYDRQDFEDMYYISLGGRSGYSEFAFFRDGILIAETACITGDETVNNGTPTGTWTVVQKSKKRVVEESGYSYEHILWLAKDGYATNYAIHSLLHYDNPANNNQVLGSHQSEGCIRVPDDLAEWLYRNTAIGTTVVIDDRSFQPSSIGYQALIKDTDYADWD